MPLRGAPFQINFGADLRGLRRGLRNASHDLRRFNTDIERIGLSGAAKLRQYVARHSRQIVAGVGIAVGTAAAAATAATVATLNSADEAQKSFQRSTGATGAQAEGQWSAVLRTLRQVPDAIGVVATAQGKLRSSVAGSELGISDLTVRLLDFVRIAGGDSAEAASSYGRALNVFSLNAAEGAAKLDTLVAVTQDFEIDGGKLLALLQTFGPVLTTVGLDFEEAAIFIGQLHQGGVDLTRIAPGINAFGRRAAAAGHDIGEAFAFAVDQIAGAANQTEALDIAQGFFGAEGANRLTSAIRSGALDLNAAGEFVDAAAGRLAEQVDGTATASDRIAETWNAIQSAMIEELLPEFQATLAHIETIAPDLARIAGQFGRGAAAVLDLGLGGTVDSLLREVLTLGRGTTPLDESTSTQYAAAEALAAVLREDDRARTAGITDPDTLAQIRSLAEEVGALTAFASDPAGFAGYYGQQDFNRDFPNDIPKNITAFTTDAADSSQRQIDLLIDEAEARRDARLAVEQFIAAEDALTASQHRNEITTETLTDRTQALAKAEDYVVTAVNRHTIARRARNFQLAQSIQLVDGLRSRLFTLEQQQARSGGGGGSPARDADTLALEASASELLLARQNATELVAGNAIGRELDEYDRDTVQAVQAWFDAIDQRVTALRDRGRGGLVQALVGDERENLRTLRAQGTITADTFEHLLGELDQIRDRTGNYRDGGGGGGGGLLGIPDDQQLIDIFAALQDRIDTLPAPLVAQLNTILQDIPAEDVTNLIADLEQKFGDPELVAAATLSALSLAGMSDQLATWQTNARAEFDTALPWTIALFGADPEGLLPIVRNAQKQDLTVHFDFTDPEGLLPLVRSGGVKLPVEVDFAKGSDPEGLFPLARSGRRTVRIDFRPGSDPEGLLPLSRRPGGRRFAAGGIVTSPTYGLIGEAGPEAVIPLDQAPSLGTTIINNFNGPVLGTDAAAEIADMLERHSRIVGPLNIKTAT